MTKTNRLTSLLGIEKPIISGGMVWCSGWRLAAAVSNAGGLGLIGAGSMHPETLLEHIQKCEQATTRPFGVNVPLLYPEMDKMMQIIMDEKVPIVVTSAGNPKTWTGKLHEAGCKVLHVVSSAKFAQKAEAAGVDAIVAEGFEAGGHNGREETTTMCLIPSVVDAVTIPVVAAGGIASGRAIEAVSKQWIDPCDPKEVFARFRKMDEKATALVSRSAKAIANLVADLVIGMDVQKVVLGGSVGLAEGYLPLVNEYLSEMPEIYRCPLDAAQLGQDAGLIGATAWAQTQLTNLE